MTDAEQIQCNRLIDAGYSAEDAEMLIERGVWLGTQEMSEQTVADINRYRAERDARVIGDNADVVAA